MPTKSFIRPPRTFSHTMKMFNNVTTMLSIIDDCTYSPTPVLAAGELQVGFQWPFPRKVALHCHTGQQRDKTIECHDLRTLRGGRDPSDFSRLKLQIWISRSIHPATISQSNQIDQNQNPNKPNSIKSNPNTTKSNWNQTASAQSESS